MDITVCVCTRDRPRYLCDCLGGLAHQPVDAARFDILVVDSASTAAAQAAISGLVRGTANARLVRVERPGVSFARNAGAEVASSRYIAFIDDDAIPDTDWIARILAASPGLLRR